VGKYYKKLSWASASFAILADIAMGTLGGKLKFKEQLTGRFADALSWMYMATAVLRRWEAEGKKKEDLPYVHYCMQTAFGNMQKAFDGIFSNLELPGLTWFFRGVVGSWSRINRFSADPSDQMSHELAVLIQTPGAQRDRICQGVYIPKDASKEHIARLEKTLLAVKAAEDTDRKVKKAVRTKQLPKMKGAALYEEALKKSVITQAEFAVLAESEKLRWDAIQVDEFTLEEYKNRA
jgi:acyl-CoA dehydrogenase